MNPFTSKLLGLKAADYARRQVEIGAHRPRLQPNALPLVFAVGDAASGHPAWVYSPGLDGDLMRIGRLVATRTATTLKVLDIYVFHDLDQVTYTPALIDYLGIEAGLFGLDRVEVEIDSSADRQRLLPYLDDAGYRRTPTGSMLKNLGPDQGAA